MGYLIEIVEDEEDVRHSLDVMLRRAGHYTRCASCGVMALELAVQSPPPDLIILDLMLPDLDGLDVCRRLRAFPITSHLPVLMLTARADESDRVRGFEAGADDYLLKPFSPRELMMRIHAILRRTPAGAMAGDEVQGFAMDGLRLLIEEGKALVDNEDVGLTAMEFRLLQYLAAHYGQIVSRETLLREVWRRDAPQRVRTIDVHINRLREKLGPSGAWIETLRGYGYRMLRRREGASPPLAAPSLEAPQ
ncbi:MAG: response regulator transcription factor [Magnetococcales bacterium]|nr:response regulator transcription factor [Magnetococcales bacterium]